MNVRVENFVENLVNVSREIGAYPEYVQGGGGNTSVKIDDNVMAIKASGYLLKSMTTRDGISFVNHSKIKKHIEDGKLSENAENDFTNLIKQKAVSLLGYLSLKPSIETGFHALLKPRFVFHTHSVYVNIICCSEGGEQIAQNLFPDSVWVNYANPGKDITIAIADAIKKKPSKTIFMQNHGLIVADETADDTYSLHESINRKIIDHFSINLDFKPKEVHLDVTDVKKKVIFPDQVVYLLSEDLRNTTAGFETLYAYDYILKKIGTLGLTPNFISKTDIDYIENMEGEKYRKSMIRN